MGEGGWESVGMGPKYIDMNIMWVKNVFSSPDSSTTDVLK